MPEFAAEIPENPGDPSDGSGGGGTAPAGYGTVVFDLNFTKVDADSALDILAYVNCYSPDDLQFSSYIFIDDNLVQSGSVNAIFDNTNSKAQQTQTLAAIIEGVSVGAHNCKVRIKNREPDGALTIFGGSLLKVIELRRAAR